MSELDLLNLGRSITASEVSLFTQVITITFAMVVAIYYFLNQAKIAMRIFALLAYSVGLFLFLGQMLIESNVKRTVLQLLAALPAKSAITQELCGHQRQLAFGHRVCAVQRLVLDSVARDFLSPVLLEEGRGIARINHAGEHS